MENWQLAVLLKPFVAFLLLFVLAYTVRRPLERHMKDGRLKRLLLKRIN